jgi:hypothetical protein
VVEHFLGKEEVGSSILLNSSELRAALRLILKRSAVPPIAIGAAHSSKFQVVFMQVKTVPGKD